MKLRASAGPRSVRSASLFVPPTGIVGQRVEEKSRRPAVDPRRQQEDLRERFAQLGPVAGRFLDGLLRDQRYHQQQALKILALQATYARADLLAALDLRDRVLDDFATLKVPLTAETFDAALARAEREGLSHAQFLHLLIAEQAHRRRERSIAHRARSSKARVTTKA